MVVDINRKYVVAAILVTSGVLIIAFLVSLFGLLGAKSGDVAGALGGVIGGGIGAGGSAASVFYMLTSQRKQDSERVYAAIIEEICEFCRFIPDQLLLCEAIRESRMGRLPKKTDLPRIMSMPNPIVYPAVADRVSLFPSPALVVSFYSCLAEISSIVQILAFAPAPDGAPDPELVTPAYALRLSHALANVCDIGTAILSLPEGDKNRPSELSTEKRAVILGRMKEMVQQVRKTLPPLHDEHL